MVKSGCFVTIRLERMSSFSVLSWHALSKFLVYAYGSSFLFVPIAVHLP